MNSLILSESEIQSINLWITTMDPSRIKDRETKQKRTKEAENTLQFQYNMLGSGKHRIGYDLGNGYVLKIAIADSGFFANEAEFNMYRECPDHLRGFLCPVIEYGEAWIIMKKMILTVPANELYDLKVSQLKNKFLAGGIIPSDMKPGNLRLSEEGEIIVIDYGKFKHQEVMDKS